MPGSERWRGRRPIAAASIITPRVLRVVTALERKYAVFDGLNLTWELLEGLVKHNGPLTGPHRSNHADPLSPVILAYNDAARLWLDRFASAEAQVAALADDIAYNSHDLDDGLRAGVIDLEGLKDVPLIAGYIGEIAARYGDLGGPQFHYEITRRLITGHIADVVATSRRRLETLAPVDADAIRSAGAPVIAFSAGMADALHDLSQFLFTEVYRSRRVMQVMEQAEGMVARLYQTYLADPARLPSSWRTAIEPLPVAERGPRIVDFVAGMTDRYAIEEHRRLFDHTPELV